MTKGLGMNGKLAVISFHFCILALTCRGQQQDSSIVKSIALGYMTAWYSGDAKQMQATLHPDLIKRTIRTLDTVSNSQIITTSSADALIHTTATGLGKKMKGAKGAIDYSLLDLTSTIAVVKLISLDFTDYLMLAKINREWKIINIIWQGKPSKK